MRTDNESENQARPIRGCPWGAMAAFAVLVLSGLPAAAQNPFDGLSGQEIFETHCSACHLLDGSQVGPSLKEIATLYPNDAAAITQWALNPGKKRPEAIQMPPMTYLGEANIHKAAEYILAAVAGDAPPPKEQAAVAEDVAVEKKRPGMLRIFMPDAGPAAIAVALPGDINYCWDAGPCRLRYAWKGDFIDPMPVWRGNGNGLAKILGKRFYESGPKPAIEVIGKTEEPEFLGYRMISDCPEFVYRLGDVTVREYIQSTGPGGGLVRVFQISPARAVRFRPGSAEGVNWVAPAGNWRDGALELTAAEAASFSVLMLPK